MKNVLIIAVLNIIEKNVTLLAKDTTFIGVLMFCLFK